jgi:uncharacterized membrane protein
MVLVPLIIGGSLFVLATYYGNEASAATEPKIKGEHARTARILYIVGAVLLVISGIATVYLVWKGR